MLKCDRLTDSLKKNLNKLVAKHAKNNDKEITKSAIVVFCAVLGLLFRLFYCLRYPVQPRDAYSYKILIEQWERIGEIVDPISFFPLSLWIMKIPHHLFHFSIFDSGIMVNIFLGILLIIISINIAMRLFKSNCVAFFVGCIIATHPALVAFSCSLLRENAYLLFSLLSLSALLEYCRKRDLLHLVSASMCGALAFLCRLEGIEFLPIVFLMFIFLNLFKKIGLSKAFLHIFIFLTVFLSTATIVFWGLKLKMIESKDITSKIDKELTISLPQ